MANVCEHCGKKSQVGHSVSHSNIKTLRKFRAAIAWRRFTDARTGAKMIKKLCAACLRTLVKMPRPRVRVRTRAKAAA